MTPRLKNKGAAARPKPKRKPGPGGNGKAKAKAKPKPEPNAEAKSAPEDAANGRDPAVEEGILARLIEGDQAPFDALIKDDPTFAYEPKTIAAALIVKGKSLIGYEKLVISLKKTKVRIASFEAALARAESDNGKAGDDGLPGRPIVFDEIEPWPVPVDGVELLTELAGAIGAYVIMDAQQRDAAALSVVFDHTHDFRDVAPIRFIVSPTKRCGKTRLERVVRRLAPRPLMASNANPAFLARTIEKHHPTLLIDEYDAIVGGNEAIAETLRGQLNSSFDRDGANVGKCVPLPGGGWDMREFSTWAATWIAGIKKIPETIEDRSVVFRLKRKRTDEKVARFRGKDGGELDILRRKIARFVADNEQRLRDIEPAMPEALSAAGDRAPDAWEPLVAIADVAGGDWPERARAAALALAGVGNEETGERNIETVLLADIRDIFERLFPPEHPAHGEEQVGRPDDGPRLFTKQLLDELHALEERPWIAWGKSRKPLTDMGLASLLRPYGVHSSNVRELGGSKQSKGYFLRSFKDVFSRYLASYGVSSRPNVPNAANAGENEVFAGVPNSNLGRVENAGIPSNSGVWDVGTAKKPEYRESGGNDDETGVSSEGLIVAAEGNGYELVVDDDEQGFTACCRPGAARDSLIEEALDADRDGVLAVLLARREGTL